MVKLVENIIECTKNNRVSVYFDMDGCCAEYSIAKEAIKSNQKDYYLNARPINSVIKVMKHLHHNGVEVKILSNCHYNEQKLDKIKWLSIHAPFIKKENINIIVYANEKFLREEKSNLKPNKLKTLVDKDEIVYFIEDDHNNIFATTKIFPEIRVFHVSCLID